MRAWEFLTEGSGGKPPITLRLLNDLKQEREWRAASHARRLARVRAMYANTDWEREQLELERMRLELEQFRTDVEASKAEARSANHETVYELARSGAEARRKNEQRVRQMARAEIHRQKKT